MIAANRRPGRASATLSTKLIERAGRDAELREGLDVAVGPNIIDHLVDEPIDLRSDLLDGLELGHVDRKAPTILGGDLSANL